MEHVVAWSLRKHPERKGAAGLAELMKRPVPGMLQPMMSLFLAVNHENGGIRA